MENKDTSRIPVSQKGLSVQKSEEKNTIGGTISIEINEKKVSVPLGITILEACKQN
jgi:hypothetical protein